MDRKLLATIVEKFSGGPVGVDNLAAAISEERETIEDVIEPYLIQQGFLQRTPRGRVATASAFRHLGLSAPQGGDLLGHGLDQLHYLALGVITDLAREGGVIQRQVINVLGQGGG